MAYWLKMYTSYNSFLHVQVYRFTVLVMTFHCFCMGQAAYCCVSRFAPPRNTERGAMRVYQFIVEDTDCTRFRHDHDTAKQNCSSFCSCFPFLLNAKFYCACHDSSLLVHHAFALFVCPLNQDVTVKRSVNSQKHPANVPDAR